MKRCFFLSSIVAVVLLVAGCSTYTETTKEVSNARRSGQVEAAAREAAKLAKLHDNDSDMLVYRLEAGSAHRNLALAEGSAPVSAAAAPTGPADSPTPSAYRDSIRFFSDADEKIDAFEEQAKTSVSAGVVAAVSNPATVPYRGQAFDKVMTSTYLALNYMAEGDIEKARASLNKAYRRQADAVADNAKKIEQEKEKLGAAEQGKAEDEKGKPTGQNVDAEKSQQDPKVKGQMDELNASLDSRIKAYGDYVNPFTVFLDGLFMMVNATDGQEQERASKQFLRVASMVDNNSYLKEDAVLAEEMSAGRATMPKTTYVIFESGEAPHKEEMIIPVPIFLVTRQTLYTQLPLSRLAYNDTYNPSLSVSAGSVQKDTATVCNMDSVVARDFKNALPGLWIDAFINASTKAVMQSQANRALSGAGGYFGALSGYATSVVNKVTTRSDTRCWQSLPKTFSYVRIATPENRTITVTTPDNLSKTIAVPDCTVSVVYVRQVQISTPLLVDAFKLK